MWGIDNRVKYTYTNTPLADVQIFTCGTLPRLICQCFPRPLLLGKLG